MAARFDVAARLDEGRQAVAHFQAYVQACSVLGPPPAGLTAAQVQDCYDAESGLDVRLLDRDCAALHAALDTVEEALSVQRAQLAELATAWRGSGADAATSFLQRHCDTAAEVTAHLRSAAQNCAALRDELWQSVDGKVATTVTIDERSAAQRSSWLAAAHTAAAGAGDHSASEELLRRQVIPYVDNDIGGEWLSAMHSTAASIGASYDAAIHALTSAPDVGFEIPGDLGPKRQPVSDEPLRALPGAEVMPDLYAPTSAVPTVPAAAPAAPPSTAEADPPSPGMLDDVGSGLTSPLGDTSGLSSGAGGLGGLGGIAGGVGGVIGSIVDGIGSLIGSLAGGLGDSSGSGDALLSDPVDGDDVADADMKNPDELADQDPVVTDDPSTEFVEPVVESPPAAPQAVDEPSAPPIDSTPAEQPPQSAATPADGSTPCEIAEDQLPQAG